MGPFLMDNKQEQLNKCTNSNLQHQKELVYISHTIPIQHGECVEDQEFYTFDKQIYQVRAK